MKIFSSSAFCFLGIASALGATTSSDYRDKIVQALTAEDPLFRRVSVEIRLSAPADAFLNGKFPLKDQSLCKAVYYQFSAGPGVDFRMTGEGIAIINVNGTISLIDYNHEIKWILEVPALEPKVFYSTIDPKHDVRVSLLNVVPNHVPDPTLAPVTPAAEPPARHP